jgi:hypothetical protein
MIVAPSSFGRFDPSSGTRDILACSARSVNYAAIIFPPKPAIGRLLRY